MLCNSSLSLILLAALTLGLGACGSESTEECAGVFRAETSTRTDIRLNEILAGSDDGMPDWIELYNQSEAPVDVGCWSVVDQTSKHVPWLIPMGTIVQPKGFHVIRADDSGVYGFNFGLGKGDMVLLRDPDGLIADEASWKNGEAPKDQSWGRIPDGSGPFQTLATPTEGSANK